MCISPSIPSKPLVSPTLFYHRSDHYELFGSVQSSSRKLLDVEKVIFRANELKDTGEVHPALSYDVTAVLLLPQDTMQPSNAVIALWAEPNGIVPVASSHRQERLLYNIGRLLMISSWLSNRSGLAAASRR